MKRFVPLILLACFIAVLSGAWLLFGTQALTAYYNGAVERARAEGRHDAAANAAERLVSLNPDSPDTRRRAASLLADAGFLSRAEYHLREGIGMGGPKQASLMAALSELYVRQDKLMDAVALMDGARGISSGEVAAMRPAAPEPDAGPGVYDRPVALRFAVPQGCAVYGSLTGEYPSAGTPWDEPVALPLGQTTVRAVAVNADGVVSALWTGEYTLGNLNFPIVFQEPALESAVRDEIGRPTGEIYSRDLANVTQLLVGQAHEYKTLDDLSALPNLERLSLRGDGPCDISALSGLPHLKEMRLENMGLDSTDIGALSGLSSLETLILPRNHVGALTALSGLTALKHLDISGNAVIDLEGLSALTSLAVLDISHNSVRDLTPLKTLTKLERLNAAGGRVSSLSGLEKLTGLTELDVSGNEIASVKALEKLTKLERLDASHNAIDSLTALSGMTALTELDLASNSVRSLEGLQSARALVSLTLNSNNIQSLAPLKDCRALETLDLDKNAVDSVEALRGLPKLRELRVENNALRSLSPLLECPALKSVHAVGNRVSADPAFGAKGITVYA